MRGTSLGSGSFSAGESLPKEPGPGPSAYRPASLQAGAWTTVPGDAGCASGCGEHLDMLYHLERVYEALGVFTSPLRALLVIDNPDHP